MKKIKKIGVFVGGTSCFALTTICSIIPITITNKKNNLNFNNNLDFNQELSQNIYDSVISIIPSGRIALDDLNAPENIEQLKRKIAAILNISTSDIEGIKFIDAGEINKANVTITFSSNIVFTLDENDPCFVQNGNVITSKKSFNYGIPPQLIPLNVEKIFNDTINDYLQKLKDTQFDAVKLGDINNYNNINKLIVFFNQALTNNNIDVVQVTSILFTVNEASNGINISISFDGLVCLNEQSSFIQKENSNTLISKQPFSINVIMNDSSNEYLSTIDIPLISQALGVYGQSVQEILTVLTNNNETLINFVSDYFPIGNKQFDASIKLSKNDKAIQFTIYFVGTSDFIQVDIFPSFGDQVVSDFIINGGVLVGLTESGKQKSTLDLSNLDIVAIGEKAFYQNSNLVSIIIPSFVKTIGVCAFQDCFNLTSVSFGIDSQLKLIDNNAFSNCKLLKSIVIPTNVISIGNYAFSKCINLSNVTFGQNSQLNSIGKNAFTNVIEINLNNCDLINENIFTDICLNNPFPKFVKDNCTINENSILNLNEITSNNNTYYDINTNTLTIPANIKSIVGKISNDLKPKLVNVNFEEGCQINSIPEYTFSGCSKLAYINIPEGVVSIGENAFFQCSSLITIKIPSSVTEIVSFAFQNCSNLQTVTFEDNSKLISIGSSAFNNCVSLQTFNLGNSCDLISIGDIWGSFSNCPKLKEIDLTNCNKMNINQYINICDSNYKIKFIHQKYQSQVFNLGFDGLENTIISIPTNIKYLAGRAPNNIISVKFNNNENIRIIPNYAFINCNLLTTIDNIPINVTTIGNNAFYNCSLLNNITIPNKVNFIGEGAFSGCSSFTTINIPNNVKTIKKSAFASCANVTNITFASNSQLISLEQYVFGNCTLLSNIDIPDSVTSIGNESFSGCTSLSNVNISNNVKTIGNSAFRNCAFSSINIPSSVVSIQNYAFDSCTNLSTVSFDTNSEINFIGMNAFNKCSTSLTTIDLNSCSSLTIEQYAEIITNNTNIYFNCSKFESLVFDLTRESGNSGTITIPTNIQYLAGRAPKTITSVNFNGNTSIKSIPYGAFQGCNLLTSIQIPNSVTSIGAYAFESCSKLNQVNIPNGVTKIESGVFARCDALRTITIPKSVESIGYESFYLSGLTSINIPNSVISIDQWAFAGCRSLRTVTFESNSKLKTIGAAAFRYCPIQSIILPDSLTSIGVSAFYNCDLTSITIPNNVKSIENSSFKDCNYLRTITFTSGSQLAMIDYDAFAGTQVTSIDLSMCTQINAIQKAKIQDNNPNVNFTFSN